MREGIRGNRAQCHTRTGVLPAPNSQSAKFQRAGSSFPFLYSSQNGTSLPRGVKDMCFLETQPKQELPPLLVGPPAMFYLPQPTNSKHLTLVPHCPILSLCSKSWENSHCLNHFPPTRQPGPDSAETQ